MLSKLLCLLILAGLASCYYDCYGCERCRYRSNGYSCRSCYDNRYEPSGQNYCLCNDGYYDQYDSNIDCIKCPTGCADCSNANRCTKCENGYQLINFKCLLNGNSAIIPNESVNQSEQPASNLPIIGIVAGAIGIVVFIIAFIIICRKCRRNAPEPQFYANKQQQTMEMKFQNSSFKKEVCSICIDESYPALCITLCGHYYHENCISLWLSRSPNCPNCVRKIEVDKIRKWCSRCKDQLMMPLQNNSKMVKVGAVVKISVKGKKDRKVEVYYSPTCRRCQKRPKTLKLRQQNTEISLDLKIN